MPKKKPDNHPDPRARHTPRNVKTWRFEVMVYDKDTREKEGGIDGRGLPTTTIWLPASTRPVFRQYMADADDLICLMAIGCWEMDMFDFVSKSCIRDPWFIPLLPILCNSFHSKYTDTTMLAMMQAEVLRRMDVCT